MPGGTSLHGRELENLRGAVLDDPLRAIQSLPAATATDDFYSEFAVRGNPFRYVGMVVDGVPTRYLMHAVNGITDGGSIAMINSDTLGSVALLPGSYPQRTGRRLGAQIDLTTREGSREQFRGRAGLSGTSAFVLGEGPIAGGKGSWLASVRRSYLDYLIKRIDPDAGFAFGFVDAQAKARLRPHAAASTLDRGARRQGRVRRRRSGHRHQRDSKGHQPRVADVAVVALSAEPARGHDATRVFNGPAVQQQQSRRGHARRRAVQRARVARGRLVCAVTRLVVEFGGDAQRLNGDNVIARQISPTIGRITLNRFDQHTSAGSAYGQVRFGLGSRFTITPGTRVDRWSLTRLDDGVAWMNAEVRLSERTRLRGGSGIYRQFPDLDQVYGLRGGGRDLRPERALHIDAGIEHTLPRQTRLLFNVYSRHEQDVLWTPGAEPRRSSSGAIVPGAFDAPWVNALSGRGARGRGGRPTRRR